LGHLKHYFGCPWKNPLLPPWKKSFRRPCRWLQQVGAPKTPAKELLFVLLSCSDYKRVYASLYLIITNFHMELKGQPRHEFSSIYILRNVW